MNVGQCYVEAQYVADGTYNGKWSSYMVEFDYESYKIIASWRKGVRGLNIPARITVTDNKVVDVKTIKDK